jgi:hypothetical protein
MEMVHRAAPDDYDRWLTTALAPMVVFAPVRLRGTVRDVDSVTGEILDGLVRCVGTAGFEPATP